MSQQITPAQFKEKWLPVTLSERAASQEHFIDLCNMLGQPTPAGYDSTGTEYAFEKGVVPTGGASKGAAGKYGYADVWWRGKFGWEYKRKDKKHDDLVAAYKQLCMYREPLENPPLLIVSDIANIEIHTNFTGTAKCVHVVKLVDIDKPESLDLLRRVFTDPKSFEPTITTEVVTREVAQQFATLARGLRDRGHDPHDAAHFLMKCMFCLFAEDVDLLPDKLFERLLNSRKKDPARLTAGLSELFGEMKTGGSFGVDDVPYFNGGLFADAPALELTTSEIAVLIVAAKQDWASVEPAIFGTLFERSLDPDTRAQIGAHYTSRDDIMLVVDPVVMAPLRREWEDVKEEVEKQVARRRKVKTRKRAADKAIEAALEGFVQRLATVRILDPACGSGNFLYVAIQQLLGLEKEVITYAARGEIALGLLPQVRPTQLLGIEINSYASELAQVVIWIGYLQWMRDNGFNAPRDPILEPLQTIECRDAILDMSDPDNPKPATWPETDFIIGNPPFLGSSRFEKFGLSTIYIDEMRKTYRLHGKSDLCCYWFARAQTYLNVECRCRVGLLATQTIRYGGSRKVLDNITASGQIFIAYSNRPWVIEGASIRVSIIGFWKKVQTSVFLDGENVASINSSLTADIDLSPAHKLLSNEDLSFEGIQKGGPFDFSDVAIARGLLSMPNPGQHRNSAVVRRRWNAQLLVSKRVPNFIVDFGANMTEYEAARYEAPFEHINEKVKPVRATNKNLALRTRWWIHKCPRPELRNAVAKLSRQLVTPRVSEHRIWAWLPYDAHVDSRLFVIARDDEYFFGVLHSAVHEIWSLRMGAIHGKGNDPTYNNTKCFETFALPWSPGAELTDHDAYMRISEAAKELNDFRERWLNPPEWIDPIAAAIDAEDDFADVPEDARALIRQSAIMARASQDDNLKQRTLTKLYNERPTWLKLSHEKLDRAVLSAYMVVDEDGDWSEDWAEVWIETGAGFPLPDDHALVSRRKEIDQLVLKNLLRLNLHRSNAE